MKIDAHSLSREQQAHFVVSEEQDKSWAHSCKGSRWGIQFESIPGMPCIYYGDEPHARLALIRLTARRL